jgi:CheY-like chemotaxis protein
VTGATPGNKTVLSDEHPMSMRPVIRVASAGLDPRDVRLIGIVFQHSQYNKYDFRMLDEVDFGGIDILIANPLDRRGLDAIASLDGAARKIPSLSAVPRGAQASARYSVTIDRLTLQLLPTLNRMVEEEGLDPALPAAATPAAPAVQVLESAAGSGIDAAIPALAPAPGQAADVPGEAAGRRPALPDDGAAVAVLADRGDGPDAAPFVGGGMLVNESITAAANAIAQAARRAADDPVAPGSMPAGPYWHGQAQRAPARARLQVLVADPSPAAQQQLARALARIGLEVHCVSGVSEALQRIAMQYTDLVVTESGLSDGDGFELIRRLRAQAAYRYTPVLLLRSRLHVMDATRARLAGEVTVLAKPLTRQALEALVRQVLRKSVILDDLSELLSPH